MSKEDSDYELFGTSPGVIAFFMILISVLVPIGIVPTFPYLIFGVPVEANFVVYGLFWFWFPDINLYMMNVLLLITGVTFWYTLPLNLFNYLYIVQIIRYYRGKCTRYSVIWVGLLSLVIPFLFSLVVTAFMIPGNVFTFIGPIPIQFIAGLVFLFKIEGPEMTSPWKGDLVDRAWWKPKRPEWWYRMFPPRKDNVQPEEESEINTEYLESK